MRKNYIVSGIIEGFLEDNPDRKREQSEMDEMDQKSTITEEEFQGASPKFTARRRTYSNYSEEEEEEEEEEEYDSEEGTNYGVYSNPFVRRCPRCTIPGEFLRY